LDKRKKYINFANKKKGNKQWN